MMPDPIYALRGWAVVPSVFSEDEVTIMAEEADRLGACDQLFKSRGDVVRSGSRSDRIDPIIDVSRTFATISSDPRLLGIAEAAVGGRAGLFKDKLIFKPPGTGGYDVHQDFAYWQAYGFPADAMTTIGVCIDPMSPSTGPVEFADGSDWSLLTPPGEIADPCDADFSSFSRCTASPGDVVLFSSLVPHRSRRNDGRQSRRVLFLTYARVQDDRDPYLHHADVAFTQS